jgi:hypothetical protein
MPSFSPGRSAVIRGSSAVSPFVQFPSKVHSRREYYKTENIE